jgi:hypothetical protein
VEEELALGWKGPCFSGQSSNRGGEQIDDEGSGDLRGLLGIQAPPLSDSHDIRYATLRVLMRRLTPAIVKSQTISPRMPASATADPSMICWTGLRQLKSPAKRRPLRSTAVGISTSAGRHHSVNTLDRIQFQRGLGIDMLKCAVS